MHESIPVHARAGSYAVSFAERLTDAFAGITAGDRRRTACLLADAAVWDLHRATIEETLRAHAISPFVMRVTAGESAKTMRSYEAVASDLVRARVDRSSILLALGGGSVTDLGGFVASTYGRGIDWIAAPTTVLGMVDASIGGKTGINVVAKNTIGTFHPPRAVVCAWELLATLPQRERASGLAEAVKCAVIRDRDVFMRLSGEGATLLDPAAPALREAVVAGARVKAAIVSADETEKGERAVLNFGHTVGHAVESATDYARWLHGEAVAIGMVVAADLSHAVLGLPREDVEALVRLLRALGLPTGDPTLDPGDVSRFMGYDKKQAGGEPRFVLTPRIGSATFGHLVSQPIVTQSLARFFTPADG